MDNSDPWDSILGIEGRMYEDGYREGQEAAIKEGIIEEGRRGGFMKGYAIGLEVAFMRSEVARILAESENSSTINAEVQSGRLHKRRVELLNRCDNLPESNVDNVNFEDEVRQIRTMYNQCNTNIEFTPRKVQEAAPTQEW